MRKQTCGVTAGMVLWMVLTAFSASGGENVKETDSSPAYTIGIGDVLSIHTWKEPDLSLDMIQVRRDGKITFPLLDDIPAAGRSTVELKQTIQEGLTRFVDAPMVTVTLINALSQQYYILGEVQQTGEYPLIKNLTVIQAFALAKGFTQWAAKDRILLYRRNGNDLTVFKIDYKDIVRGQMDKDISLQADDIIIVP
jgi:polysaccharide export outer membrane protein